MRFIVLLVAFATSLATAVTTHAASPADLDRLVMLICGKHLEVASYAENQTRELCQAEFTEEGKRYVVAYWMERSERLFEAKRDRPPVRITNVHEWITFSIIEVAQFEHFDYAGQGAILEQWASIDRHTGLVRSGMHGYAFKGGFDPPFDRYREAELPEIPEAGPEFKDRWQKVLDHAVRVALEHGPNVGAPVQEALRR